MNIPINEDGDAIANAKSESWKQGACPKPWVIHGVHTKEFTEEFV